MVNGQVLVLGERIIMGDGANPTIKVKKEFFRNVDKKEAGINPVRYGNAFWSCWYNRDDICGLCL